MATGNTEPRKCMRPRAESPNLAQDAAKKPRIETQDRTDDSEYESGSECEGYSGLDPGKVPHNIVGKELFERILKMQPQDDTLNGLEADRIIPKHFDDSEVVVALIYHFHELADQIIYRLLVPSLTFLLPD